MSLITYDYSAFIQFFQDIILYGFSTFLPSILRLDLGYSSIQAQYLSVPVYALGGISFLVSTLILKLGTNGDGRSVSSIKANRLCYRPLLF